MVCGLFQIDFIEIKNCISIQIAMKFVPKWPLLNKSANELTPNRWQTVIRIFDDPVHKSIYASPSLLLVKQIPLCELEQIWEQIPTRNPLSHEKILQILSTLEIDTSWK